MAGDPRVLGLLEEMLDSGKTPEEVCRDFPDLLPEVRERWREFRCIDAAVVELLPGLRTIPAAGVVTPAPPAADLPQVPDYELLGEVGRGGMGVVHRAKDLALDRDVAVKLLQDRYPADSPVARRFTDEARITAQLQHPGVPAVYRVGALPDGRPFLAMKLIKGHTLAELLARRPDPSADRGRFVAIFERICQAMAYAHSLRVVHRDLKPSNVMVGRFGEVQVMDWGLAKVLPEGGPAGGGPARRPPPADGTVIRTRPVGAADTPGGSGSPTPPTRTGTVLGTPAYMAPEQAGGEAALCDVRCDVFGLGAVLCVVLTGKPPYTGRDEDQIFRKAMAANQADAHARLDACGAEPGLVALCRRCLAAEPDDRPRDASEVAEAVAALRAAAEERARRAELDRVRAAEQGKRRRVLLAASGIIAAVLLAGLSVSLWQTRRAVQAEAAANASADQAQLHAEEAERNARQAGVERDARGVALAAEQRARRDEAKARRQAFDALRSMTAGVVERKFAQGAVLTEDDRAFLRGVIAQFDAFAAIRGDDADSRAVRAEGRFRVGTIRYRLGEIQAAEQHYDEALSTLAQLAADFPDRAEFRQKLAASHTNRGMVRSDTGRLTEAEKDWNEALSIQKQLAADFPDRAEFRQELAGSHLNRGNLRRATGRLREAEEDFGQALRIQQQLAADLPSRPDLRQALAGSHSSRGVLRRDTGRLKGAEEDFDQAVGIRTQLVADFPTRPEFRQALAGNHLNRGILRRDTGRLKGAEEDFNQALSIQKQLAAEFPSRPDLRQELANGHNSRGILLGDMGRLNEAEEEFDQALSIHKQLAADFPNRPDFRRMLASSHANRGSLLRMAGRLPEAEKDHGQALTIYTQLAADSPDQPDLRGELAGTYVHLAILQQMQGNWAAAKRLLLEGRPHHLAALKTNPRHPSYRQFYHRHLLVLAAAHAGLLEQDEAVRTAETRRDVGWDAPADAYYAACVLSLCVPVVAEHDKLDATQREEAARFYGDAAMKLLREAVGKGFKNVAHVKKDTDLDPLRRRDDFRKLVTELEEKGK
jgi:serine/threonine protein kinase